MTTKIPTPKTVFGKWTQPLAGLVQQCHYKRKCNTLPDQTWIKTGLLRTLSQEPSGRAFLQKLSDSGRPDIKRSHFFETLKSNRRLKLCREISRWVYEKTRSTHPPLYSTKSKICLSLRDSFSTSIVEELIS